MEVYSAGSVVTGVTGIHSVPESRGWGLTEAPSKQLLHDPRSLTLVGSFIFQVVFFLFSTFLGFLSFHLES